MVGWSLSRSTRRLTTTGNDGADGADGEHEQRHPDQAPGLRLEVVDDAPHQLAVGVLSVVFFNVKSGKEAHGIRFSDRRLRWRQSVIADADSPSCVQRPDGCFAIRSA